MKTLDLNCASSTDIESWLAGRPKIRLAFFDVDGTILQSNGQYTERLARTIDAVRRCGIKTGIASGRPAFAAQFLADELNLSDMGVFCSGSQVFEPSEQKHLEKYTLGQKVCEDLLEKLRQYDLYYELYTSDAFYIENNFALEISRVHAEHLRCAPRFQNFDSILYDQSVIKLLIGADQTKDSQTLRMLEEEFPYLHFAYAGLPAYPDWLFASIIDKKACKKKVFQQVIDYYDIAPEEVIAFGDAQSDMIFNQLAGVGVAMGNAIQPLKDIADVITLPVDDDGLAFALEALVLNQYDESV